MLIEKLKKYNIYLASQSPRRQKLLEQMDIEFNIATKIYVDETIPQSLSGDEIAIYLALKKSDAYKNLLKDNRLLITADTIVIKENKIFGKPKNKTEALNMLSDLSDSKHLVITGITLRTTNKIASFSAITEVWFRKLSDNEINYYIDKYKPFDKAGAYGIQEWIGINAIEKINGSYFNVVGLPTEKLYTELEKFIDN
jgi:septum formation protein